MRDMRVVEYSSTWPAAYEAEAAKLRAALGDELVRVHHIGSTAVPCLTAKPVIDILVEVRDVRTLDVRDAAMRAIGYEPRGEFGIPGRRYYAKGGDRRTHHVHAFAVGDPHVAEHLAFRDYLRAHPAAAATYARAKRDAAARHRHDPGGYVAQKEPAVRRILSAAQSWADEQRTASERERVSPPRGGESDAPSAPARYDPPKAIPGESSPSDEEFNQRNPRAACASCP